MGASKGPQLAERTLSRSPSMNSLAHTTTMFRHAISQFWRSLAAAPLGEPAPAHIPSRLRGVIAQEHKRGELLIAWAQGALLLIWSALYALAPRALPSQAFESVPWTLAAYGAFIIVRLILIYQNRLADWHVALSIIVDIGVLMLLIWSFHLQYGQPPAFYLKAPTLLYVFIFIALRTLSFEARWVLLAGAVSAAGWGGLLLYAVVAQSDNPPVTHDYVHYMNSSSILLGAEFDKIVSILMVTAVLALALRRTQQLVLRCVVDHAAANELSRFVARGLAQNRARRGADRARSGGAEIGCRPRYRLARFHKDFSPPDASGGDAAARRVSKTRYTARSA